MSFINLKEHGSRYNFWRTLQKLDLDPCSFIYDSNWYLEKLDSFLNTVRGYRSHEGIEEVFQVYLIYMKMARNLINKLMMKAQ